MKWNVLVLISLITFSGYASLGVDIGNVDFFNLPNRDGKEDLEVFLKSQNFEENFTLPGLGASGNSEIVVIGQKEEPEVWCKKGADYSLFQKLIGHQNLVKAVAISDNGSIIVTGFDDTTVQIWKKDKGLFECVQTVTEHANIVTAVATSNDGKIIVTGSADETVQVLKNKEGEWEPLQKFDFSEEGPDAEVTAVALSQDESVIVVGLLNGNVIVWKKIGKDQWNKLNGFEVDSNYIEGIIITENNQKIIIKSSGKFNVLSINFDLKELKVAHGFWGW